MADEEEEQVENSFDILMRFIETSGNLRKGIKRGILQSVNTLKKVFVKMKTQLVYKSNKNNKLSEEVLKVTEEIDRTSDSQPARKLAPSLDKEHQIYSVEARQ